MTALQMLRVALETAIVGISGFPCYVGQIVNLLNKALAVTKATTRQDSPSAEAQFHAVMQAAEDSGLLGEKSARIGGRISAALIERAKQRTGIKTNTDLIEFALANVALDDDFAKTLRKVAGTVDPGLKLGF